MRIGRVTVRGGFVLLWGIMIYLDAGRVPVLCVLTALLHEAGHLIAVWLCGGRVASVELNVSGAVITLSDRHALSYGKEILCVLAGPLVSLAGALIFCLLGDTMSEAYAVSGLCLLQGAFNLLPASGLDGGRALSLVLNGREYAHTDKVLRITTLCSAWAMALLCAAAFVGFGYNAALPVMLAFSLMAMLSPGAEPSRGGERRVVSQKSQFYQRNGHTHAKRYRNARSRSARNGGSRDRSAYTRAKTGAIRWR